MSTLLELAAAAVQVEAKKASVSTKRIKRAKYVPLRGPVKKDIWGPALDGRAVVRSFDFNEKSGKLMGTDQQVDTFVATDEKDGENYRYLVIQRLESWVDEKGAKVTKLRKHVARLSRVSDDNPDFLEGSCRDYYITNKDGTKNYYGCVNRMTWEYGAGNKDVEISYQRLEDPILGREGIYFVFSMEVYEDAQGIVRTRFAKLNDARKESNEVLFFNTQEEELGWEEWYAQGCAGAGSMIEWDVLPFVVLYADDANDWHRVLQEYEELEKSMYTPDVDDDIAEMMALLGM